MPTKKRLAALIFTCVASILLLSNNGKTCYKHYIYRNSIFVSNFDCKTSSPIYLSQNAFSIKQNKVLPNGWTTFYNKNGKVDRNKFYSFDSGTLYIEEYYDNDNLKYCQSLKAGKASGAYAHFRKEGSIDTLMIGIEPDYTKKLSFEKSIAAYVFDNNEKLIFKKGNETFLIHNPNSFKDEFENKDYYFYATLRLNPAFTRTAIITYKLKNGKEVTDITSESFKAIGPVLTFKTLDKYKINELKSVTVEMNTFSKFTGNLLFTETDELKNKH